MKLFLVARITQTRQPRDPQVIAVDSCSGADDSETAARMYAGVQPGTRLGVWNLGLHPATFHVAEDGKQVYKGERL